MAQVAIGILVSAFVIITIAPEFMRNLAMLAYMRHWTRTNDASLLRLSPLVRWWVSIERADPLLQAQAAAVLRTLGYDEAALETLEKARSLAPIAQHCVSQDAMQIEYLARPLLPVGDAPKMLALTAHTASSGTISQMRTVFAEDGGSACMHIMTTVLPEDRSAFASMSAPLPVQSGHRYRVRTECYVTGSLETTIDVVDSPDASAPISTQDAWTTTVLELTPTANHLTRIQITARSGAGRIACRDIAITDLTAAR